MSEEVPYCLAIDPGGHTGLAWMIGNEFGSAVLDGGRFGFLEAWVMSLEVAGRPDFIVCEDFIITSATARKSAQPDPYRIIGYVEGWCFLNQVPFKLQTPSQAKGFGTDAKLKHLGWYRAGNGGHDNDAARHLLVHLTACRHEATIQSLREFL